jgi:hypothetical protein
MTKGGDVMHHEPEGRKILEAYREHGIKFHQAGWLSFFQKL